jgi:mRNA interferase MazF
VTHGTRRQGHHQRHAQAEQVRSISVERVGPALGQLSVDVTGEVDEALRLHLAL